MRKADLYVGKHCWTKSGDRRIEVRVTSIRKAACGNRLEYTVEHADPVEKHKGRELKPRSAAQLHSTRA